MKDRIRKIIDDFENGVMKDFACRIGASTGNVGDWLSGKSRPGGDKRSRICESYSLNREWLEKGIGPMQEASGGHIAGMAGENTYKAKEGTTGQKEADTDKDHEIGELEKEIAKLRSEVSKIPLLLEMIEGLKADKKRCQEIEDNLRAELARRRPDSVQGQHLKTGTDGGE